MTLSISEKAIRENALFEMGFSQEAIDTIHAYTSRCYIDPIDIRERIEYLRKLGFKDPVGLIEKMPSVLSLAQESVGAKIENLRELGFENPVRLVEKMPQVLSYAQNKVALTVRLIEVFGYPCDVKKMCVLVSRNVESLVLASLGAEDYTDLFKRRMSIRGSTKEKRARIYERMDMLDAELVRLYQERWGLKEVFLGT